MKRKPALWEKRYAIAAMPTDESFDLTEKADEIAVFEALDEEESLYEIGIALARVENDEESRARAEAEKAAWQRSHAHLLGSLAYQAFKRRQEAYWETETFMKRIDDTLSRMESGNGDT